MTMDRRTFIKRINWVLASSISMLGFVGCEKESGTNYTVRGAVVNKESGEPIARIRVGYGTPPSNLMYGIIPTPFDTKTRVMTNTKGEFILTDRFQDDEFLMIDNKRILPVFVDDVDGEEKGRYQSAFIWVEFPKGVHTVTVDDMELIEIKN